jgi:hypothetical protein
MPTWERLSDSASEDVDLPEFFGAFRYEPPVDGVPACVLGRLPRAERRVLDTAMMTNDGRFEIFRYAKRYILDHYFTKSLRCKSCIHDASCRGVHVNYVRSHGYAALEPVVAAPTEPVAADATG